MSDVKIRRAIAGDTDALVCLYQAAQRWLAEIGSDQWAKNTEQKIRTNIACSIDRGECWLAETGDGIVVGMITVDDYADPDFWTPQDDPHDALYVHRMVVDRGVSGKGVGAQLLDWAESLAASRGRKWLRLDAWRTNVPLHAYYERQGFAPVRIVELSYRGSGALFQRRVRPSLVVAS
jgi:GNAT superfamily N-acetyltransferase